MKIRPEKKSLMLPARTPRDRKFVLVAPDILEMDGNAHVLDAFLL